MHLIGHYRALEWNEKDQVYAINPELGILTEITVSLQLVNAAPDPFVEGV